MADSADGTVGQVCVFTLCVSRPLSSERQRSEVKPIMELEKDSDIHSARDDKAFVAMGTEGKRSVLAELFPEPRDQQTCSGPHPLSFQNLVL